MAEMRNHEPLAIGGFPDCLAFDGGFFFTVEGEGEGFGCGSVRHGRPPLSNCDGLGPSFLLFAWPGATRSLRREYLRNNERSFGGGLHRGVARVRVAGFGVWGTGFQLRAERTEPVIVQAHHVFHLSGKGGLVDAEDILDVPGDL